MPRQRIWSENANSDLELRMDESDKNERNEMRHLLLPRPHVTSEELGRMPASLKPAEAQPWSRLSRSAFYSALRSGEVSSCRLGHAIRIPTRRFLLQIGVLDED
jgi:hypothetical protein